MKELIRKILNEEDRRKNKTQQFQKLIDDEIESMKEICKQMSADDEEIISFDACDFLDLNPKVIVTDVDKFYGKLRILVLIKYESAMHFHDEEAFIYELQSRLKWVGDVMIDVEDVINTYSDNKLNETFTGDTPTDITKQFINKPVKLIGDVNTTTKIQNINVNNDGSVNIFFQNGMKVNSSLPMLRRFNLEVDIPLEFKIKKKGNINESEETKSGKYTRALEIITNVLKKEDFVCDIEVKYYGAADTYEVIVKIDKKEMETNFEKLSIWYAEKLIKEYLSDLRKKVEKEIKDFLPVKVLVYIDQFSCNKNLNESEGKKGKYITMIEDLAEDFKNEDCVCDIKIGYNPDKNDYLINVKVGTMDLDDKFNGINYQIRDYINRLGRKIKKGIQDYIPIPLYIEFKQTPKCSDYKNLNESEEKKSRLLSNIEENGLYEVISSTGLHINEIEQKVGQLSREVLERFIKDVVKEHFQVIDDDGKTYIIYLEDYPFDVVPIGNSDYVEQLRVIDNKLIFVVALYDEDEYGDQEFSSEELTPSKNLLYMNIYEIAEQLGFLLSKGRI